MNDKMLKDYVPKECDFKSMTTLCYAGGSETGRERNDREARSVGVYNRKAIKERRGMEHCLFYIKNFYHIVLFFTTLL